MSQPKGFQDKVSLIWSVADILRGDFKPHEYGQTILPFVVLRRLECALEKKKDKVIAKSKSLEGKITDLEAILNKESGHNFYNTSPLSLTKILQDPDKVASNLKTYIQGFSPSAAEVLEKYGFPEKIKKLEEKELLYQIIGKFADLDLSIELVTNETMGFIFEELLRKFSEMSNETAGEHYTPREVIRLMVNLLFIEDAKALAGQRPIRSIYDPACGTGGMLSIAEEYLKDLNPNITLNVFGQELNDETWAMARSDLMIKGQDPARITYGNSLTNEDGHAEKQFDYCISNPPYGVDWKKYSEPILNEHQSRGFDGRYGAGLPRVSDGSLLFIQHMISKMKPYNRTTGEGGSRIAVILSASTLISGQAGSGESEIRRWIIENDWLEGIIALPDQLFYNTEIGTYVWIITNRKNNNSKGLVRLIDAREFGTKLPRSLGDKKKMLTEESITEITRLYSESFRNRNLLNTKVMKNEEMGFARLTVEKPLKRIWKIDLHSIRKLPDNCKEILEKNLGAIFYEEESLKTFLKDVNLNDKELKLITKTIASSDVSGQLIKNKKGELSPDLKLRDTEVIPLPDEYISMQGNDRIAAVNKLALSHLRIDIHPYIADAWIDLEKTKIGYEIPFTREFFTHKPPRIWTKIRTEIVETEKAINAMQEQMDLATSSLVNYKADVRIEDLQSLPAPDDWNCVPLFSLGSRISEDGYADLEPLSVYLNLGVIPRSSRVDNKNALGSDMAKYQRVIAGDLVINKLRTWQGGFGIAKQEGIVSPAYYVFRFTDSQVRPEFVDLLLKSPTYLAAITRVTRWMPPSQYDTAWEDLKGIPIWYPPLGKQDSMLEQSTNIRNVQSILVQLSALQSKYDEYRKSMSNYLFLGTIAPEKTGKQNND